MVKLSIPDLPAPVAKVIDAYPAAARRRFMAIRKTVYDVARANPEIGPITETLKWGEPAYLTEKSKSGSTVRIDFKPKYPDHIAMYFNCQTTIVGDIKRRFAGEVTTEDNRAVWIGLNGRFPKQVVVGAIETALMYHRNKRR